jgi:hypothetical protein
MRQNRALDLSGPRGALRPRLIPALGWCAAAALLCVGLGIRPPSDATARMEQLAGHIDRARALHPDATRDLEQLMDMPQYDCARIACSLVLQTRNQEARERLRQSIARKMQPGAAVASGHASR